MKDSSQYAKKVQKLYRTLKQRAGKVAVVTYGEPVDALVYSVISEKITESETESAIKKLKDYFVDWNDLRVATVDEIVETLRQDMPGAKDIATALVTTLKAVFEKHHMLSLQGLKKLGKRPAKLLLEKLAGITHFVVDYCMLTALEGHAIPLTPKMLEYLKTNELIDAEAGYEDVEGFLARQIPMKNAFEFYSLLRRESESPKTHKSQKENPRKKRKR